MVEQELRQEENEIKRKIAKDGISHDRSGENLEAKQVIERKRRRWDDETSLESTPKNKTGWDIVPQASSSESNTKSRWDVTPALVTSTFKSKWDDATSEKVKGSNISNTPTAGQSVKKKSRWDETPAASNVASSFAATPGATPRLSSLPGETPLAPSFMTPEIAQQKRWEAEVDERNRPMSDGELDSLLPLDGYKILDPPIDYASIRTPQRKLLATPTPLMATPAFNITDTPSREGYAVPPTPNESAMPYIKPEDFQYFGKLLDEVDEENLPANELKERKVLKLLLRIKNGTPPQRKSAMRQITDKADEFGPEVLFNQILPLLMSPALEDQERHLLVKVIDRVLYKLGDLVRPYVHKILVVIEPLLIDEDYYARVEGREIISNLSKAAGLATMIATMRPDIDHTDEYVRNTTARAFAVVASALGIPALLPFLKAVCQSRKSWQARHTGNLKLLACRAIKIY